MREIPTLHYSASVLPGDETQRLLDRVSGSHRPPVTSTKSQTGHEMWMAGASEVVYSLLMMKNGFIAGSLNFERPDDVTACLNIIPETRETAFNVFLSNSFGFGGTNSTLIVRNLENKK